LTEKPVAAGSASLSFRNPGLDYLRTLSISIVLANHCLIGFFFDAGRAQWSGLTAQLSASAIISIEWLFVLSGYLIGTMMIRSFERPGTWASRTRDFWLRRWFRTIPNYYLFLLVNVALVYLGVAAGTFQWTYLVFSQNLVFPEQQPHFFGESWSLATDEWFYFLMPLILGLVMLYRRIGVQTAFLLTAAILIVGPIVTRSLHPVPADFFAWDAQIRRITVYHLDATGWGVLAAAVNRWHKPWWTSAPGTKALAGAATSVLGLAMIWLLVGAGWQAGSLQVAMNALSLTLMGAGTFLILPWLTSLSMPRGVFDHFVEKTSLYSYSIYLCHFPLIFIVRHLLSVNREAGDATIVMAVVIWLALVYALSAAVFHSFEKPVSDLRERYTRRVSTMPF
jgi:peptidoglycan/LPS O-acetylase OafA/YrhL